MLKSLGGVSSVLTNIILATSPHSPGAAVAEAKQKISIKEDAIVMDTKLKIIEILQVSVAALVYLRWFTYNYIELYTPVTVTVLRPHPFPVDTALWYALQCNVWCIDTDGGIIGIVDTNGGIIGIVDTDGGIPI